jgi:hypothetical protein
MIDTNKLNRFAKLVQDQQIARLIKAGLSCQTNIDNCRTSIKPGKKFIKVDVGGSGKYMVEIATGNIFGIKGYGVVHLGHYYGTLDTIDQYYWGDFYPEKLQGEPLPPGKTRACTCPGLTYAPTPTA